MKHDVIRRSMFVLLIGLFAVTAGRANAIELLSLSWGLAPGEVARVSIVVFGDASVRSLSPAIARVQLLDTEGEVIAESDEIKVAPGQIRFWDVPRELLPAGDPNGRKQVRAMIKVTPSDDRNRTALGARLEIFDPGTGRTSAIDNFANFQRFLAPPVPVP